MQFIYSIKLLINLLTVIKKRYYLGKFCFIFLIKRPHKKNLKLKILHNLNNFKNIAHWLFERK